MALRVYAAKALYCFFFGGYLCFTDDHPDKLTPEPNYLQFAPFENKKKYGHPNA